MMLYSALDVVMEPEVKHRLREWRISYKAELLSVRMARDLLSSPSPICPFAENNIMVTLKLGLPVVSHSCRRMNAGELRNGDTREEHALLDLTYSLIHQVTKYVPVEFETDLDFSTERFGSPDKTWKTWNEALLLLSDLLLILSSIVLCVVDNFHYL